MKLDCEDYEHVAVVAVRGELVREELERFQYEVDKRVERGTRDFVLDLSQTEFIDSQGLEAMLQLQERCGQHLGQMRLAGCHKNVEQILTVTRLSRRFDQHFDVDSAIKSLR
jgi:anti-anti-sigma factor